MQDYAEVELVEKNTGKGTNTTNKCVKYASCFLYSKIINLFFSNINLMMFRTQPSANFGWCATCDPKARD
jgi:hypothetical protein